jgi:hypothetical protein
MSIIILFVAVLGILFGLVVYGTFAKNRWGINLDPVSCPKCHVELSPVRKPKSLKQALWGGWTCDNCGTEVDKWGRVVGRSASD